METKNSENQTILGISGVKVIVLSGNEGAISLNLQRSLKEIINLRDQASALKSMGVNSISKDIFTPLTPSQPYPGLEIKLLGRHQGPISVIQKAMLKNLYSGIFDWNSPEVKQNIEASIRFVEEQGGSLPKQMGSEENSNSSNDSEMTHLIPIIGGQRGEAGIFSAKQMEDGILVTFKYRDKELSAKESDAFEALIIIRLMLEEEGLKLFCYGASLNVYATSDLREKANGLLAVRIIPGQEDSPEDFVRIFDYGVDVFPSSVDEQETFWDEYIAGDIDLTPRN